MSFPVEAVLSIAFVLRAVLCAVKIKLQKEIIFLRVLLYCMTKSYPLEQFPHSQRCQNPDITVLWAPGTLGLLTQEIYTD